MSHVYQPLMIRTILAGGGAATRRQIAGAFLSADLSQLEYYEQITKGYPTQTLRRHGIVEHERGVYRLTTTTGLNEWERASLISLCDAKVAEYIGARQDAIWRHRKQNFEPIPGSLRYQVIKRAMGRCEACGISNRERALQVDHVVPRAKNGSNDVHNLQALCSTCNGQKHDNDLTDFHAIHELYEARSAGCPFCDGRFTGIVIENSLAYVVEAVASSAKGHRIIVPRRHVSSYFDLHQPEINAIRSLERSVAEDIQSADRGISGFEIKIHVSQEKSQFAGHCQIHLIPMRF